MDATRQQIVRLIIDKVGVGEHEITDDVDINRGLGCTGDDFHELMDEFAKKFSVDMSGYLWYFHTEEEGTGSIGGWFFKAPNERVPHISVTPRILLEAVSTGKWPIIYPEHKMPKHRWDLTINLIFLMVVLAWAATSLSGC